MKAVCAALAVFAMTPAAFAAAPANPLAKDSVVLTLANLDLATVEGQHALASRMGQAARDVCGDHVATIHLALAAESRTCQAEVVANIRARIEQRTADAGHVSADAIRIAMR